MYFFLGLFVGAYIGMIVLGLCRFAAMGGENMERPVNGSIENNRMDVTSMLMDEFQFDPALLHQPIPDECVCRRN